MSAEAYCTGNGNDGREVIPIRLRRLIVESTDGFSAWRDVATSTIKPSITVETEMKLTNAVLLKMLLEVYMSMDNGKGTELDGKPSQIQSQQQIQVARLLNSQGVHLDVGDVSYFAFVFDFKILRFSPCIGNTSFTSFVASTSALLFPRAVVSEDSTQDT